MRGTTLTLCLVSIALGLCPSARAEEVPTSALVPVVIGKAEAIGLGALRQQAHALRESDAQVFAEGRSLGEQFDMDVSAAPARVAPADIDRWLKQSRDAVEYLVRGDYGRALKSLRRAQRLSEAAAEALNRELSMARRVLDTCLLLVRSLWETDEFDRAHEQARKCRRLVPSIDPTEAFHTPEVNAVLRQLDEGANAQSRARLTVESPKPGCTVRINGLALGQTPFVHAGLVPGDYRIQVECAEQTPGRVHSVEVGQDSRIFIDPSLDHAVRTAPELHLAYDSEHAFSEGALRHAQALAAALGLEEVILFSSTQLVRVHQSRGFIASEPVRSSEEAIGALIKLQHAKLPSEKKRAPQTHLLVPNTRKHRTDSSRKNRIAGLSLVGLGVGTAVGAWGLYGRRVQLGKTFSSLAPSDPGFSSARSDWLKVRKGLWVMGPLGATFIATGVALSYRERPKMLWWGWAIGGAGVGLLAYGITEMVLADTCPRNFTVTPVCVPGQQAIDRGALLIAQGTALSFSSLWMLARRSEVRVGVSHQQFVIWGRF